jgi:hypothetical protein
MITDYYGGSTDRTILRLFTHFSDGRPQVIHREALDADAYDSWHLAFYFKELLESRNLLKKGPYNVAEIPRKEKNLLVYLMLAANPDLRQVTELGSSLFELIDALEFVQRCVPSTVAVDDLHYFGVELSDLLIRAAEELHPGIAIEHVRTVAEATKPLGLLYDRNVSSYAFETADEFAAFVNRSELALVNGFFSNETTFAARRLGKRLTYFSLNEFAAALKHPMYHLFGARAPGPKSGEGLSGERPVIEGFFLIGPSERADRIMQLAKSNPAVASWFAEKTIKLTPVQSNMAA